MNQDTLKQLTDSLKPLADKLGQGAAHLYEVYVRQMVAEGVTGLVAATIGLVMLIVAWFIFWRMVRTKALLDERDPDYFGYFMVGLFAGILTLVAFVPLLLIAIQDNTLKIINPEYAAIQRLVETVRGDSH